MNKNIYALSICTILFVAIMLCMNGVSAFASPATVDLGYAQNFTILSYAGITNVPTSNITGDIGSYPISGSGIALTCAEISGTIYSSDSAGPLPCRVVDATLLNLAVNSIGTAYTDATSRATDQTNPGSAGEIGGLTLTPGVYTFTGGSNNVHISTDLTLSGGPNDVFIFQIPGTLDIASATQIKLIGGAQAKNVFWAVGMTTALGTTSVFNGNIIDQTDVTLANGATLNGRALSQTADVTLDANRISLPVTTNVGITNYTILLNSTENSSTTSSMGSITIDGTSFNLSSTGIFLDTFHNITFVPANGFTFLRWNATNGIIVSNNLTTSTTIIITGNGTLNAIYYNISNVSRILTTISSSTNSLNLTIGSSAQLDFVALDQFGLPINSTINYTSTDTSIVQVDQTGFVTSTNSGSASIIASNGAVNGSVLVLVTTSPPPNNTPRSHSGSGGGGSTASACGTVWTCTEWNSCSNGIQSRTCSYMKTQCIPKSEKPVESQACTTESDQDQTSDDSNSDSTSDGNGIITGHAIDSDTGAGLSTPMIIVIVLASLGVIGTAIYFILR